MNQLADKFYGTLRMPVGSSARDNLLSSMLISTFFAGSFLFLLFSWEGEYLFLVMYHYSLHELSKLFCFPIEQGKSRIGYLVFCSSPNFGSLIAMY